MIRSIRCCAWTNNPSSCSRRLGCRSPRRRAWPARRLRIRTQRHGQHFHVRRTAFGFPTGDRPRATDQTDWAIEVAQLLDTRYADRERVTLVLDNLNTHTKGAFYEAFEPERARAYIKRIDFCYTPKHGSWLNVAECELSCLTSQCLSDRRIGELTELQSEIGIWSDKTNAKQRGVDWQFRIENARMKLKRLYPKIKA